MPNLHIFANKTCAINCHLAIRADIPLVKTCNTLHLADAFIQSDLQKVHSTKKIQT